MLGFLRRLFAPRDVHCCCPATEIECCPGETAPSSITATINAPGCCIDGDTFSLPNTGTAAQPNYAGSTPSGCGGTATIGIDCPSGVIYQVGDCTLIYPSFPCSPGDYEMTPLSDLGVCGCDGSPTITITIAWS